MTTSSLMANPINTYPHAVMLVPGYLEPTTYIPWDKTRSPLNRLACWSSYLMLEHVWNVMAHAQKPDLVFQRNGRDHLNRRGTSVQSTTGSRGVRISGSNAGYTVFWGRVQDYWLPTPFVCFPFTSPTVRHRVPSGFNWALPILRTRCGTE